MTDRIDTAKERGWLKRLPLTISEVRHSHACDGGYSVVGGAAATAIARELTPRFDALLDALDAERAENERLREALVRMVEELACDDPECDICAPARAALNPEGGATSGSSKWGPQFPPSSCTAYEDCVHDGVCHDPNCGAPSQHGEGET